MVFSSKAEKYEKYRWRYATQAIQAIFELTGIGTQSCIADIGAGTGILTREFAGKVGQIFAVEPNPQMRAIARRELAQYPSCQVVDGRAEATGLASHSVNLVTAAQAVHWFEPQAAKQEFLRILKPCGWLALLRNNHTSGELGAALAHIYPSDLDTRDLMVGKDVPLTYYYGQEKPTIMEFPFILQLSWGAFMGAMSTASHAPDEGSPAYTEFELGARRIFDEFSSGGFIEQHVVTNCSIGRMVGEDAGTV